MPELPEVEVVRRGLAEHVVGRTIVTAELRGARVARRHLPGPVDLTDRVAGHTVEAARRRGKYLWLVLVRTGGEPVDVGAETPTAGTAGAAPADRFAMLVHLGMSGQLLVADPGSPDPSHLHARFSFTDGGPELRFADQRTFGGMFLAELDDQDLPTTIAHIAPDPFEPAYDQVAVVRRAKGMDREVKRILLDQTVVSGIGNIYADEALWRAGIHGQRLGSALTKPALDRLLDHAREVMAAALGQGGTSFDALYVNVNGASGYFDRSLHAYGQEGQPCDRCGTPIRRTSFMNRSSFFCPHCQPVPRRRA